MSKKNEIKFISHVIFLMRKPLALIIISYWLFVFFFLIREGQPKIEME